MINFFFASLTLISSLLISNFAVSALPPKNDTPEEILATEIIIEARSPIDNKPLTVEEYALLQEKIVTNPFPPNINSELRQKIFLLQILKMIRTISPINN
ncbi:hypothetical protein GM3708_2751 [Geminocystis sp. NIES-3708]|uniref:hypothetical protein n=1 Tax=Geminocystis sp. NIES-3708 TaxID=1615909 RepID=UPI0005FC9E4A|nr:hypothetical protein [Geminocystis sp. NIES-3708]BAQ62345.1 hypothetical protein GM3708_2751 [Geminocystis sp. NIES-3708]